MRGWQQFSGNLDVIARLVGFRAQLRNGSAVHSNQASDVIISSCVAARGNSSARPCSPGSASPMMQPGLPPLVRDWLPDRIGFGTAVYATGLLVGEIIPVALDSAAGAAAGRRQLALRLHGVGGSLHRRSRSPCSPSRRAAAMARRPRRCAGGRIGGAA